MNAAPTRTIHTRIARASLLMLIALLLCWPASNQVATAASNPTDYWLPIIANQPQATAGQVPRFKHVFTIVLENTGYADLFQASKAPYIQSLIQRYALADNYYGVQHPSLPNYLALIGGDTFGIDSNCTSCRISGTTLVDQMEAAGISWKAYMESMPRACYAGDKSPLYRQKHNPFMYFDAIRNDPVRCNKIVPFSEFEADAQANALPSYIWITPNMCNNMHDCSIQTGDAWLQTWVSRIIATPAWQNSGVLFITFDEGDLGDDNGCCVYALGGHLMTLVVSPLGKPGYRSPLPYTHYSLLRTIQTAWGLPPLAKAGCACSPPMSDFFITTLDD